MERVLDSLKSQSTRASTAKNYHTIWTKFNKFLIRLDRKPKLWENRVALFCADMVERGIKSTTVRSYVSAIKKTLRNDNYDWDDNLILMESLIKACKIRNDHVRTRLPIQIGLLELILFELQRLFNENYTIILYRAIFALAYYGLMRISELTTGNESNHFVRAKDIHVGVNKNKILIILYSSKTHGRESRPQQIKITANDNYRSVNRSSYDRSTNIRHFCPFSLLRDFMSMRGDYDGDDEPLFIFPGKMNVEAKHVRLVLKKCIKNLNLNECLYDTHSFRAGMASDLMRNSVPIAKIKQIGRWKSSVVYTYLKNI